MFPNIQIKYLDSFPENFINDVNSWAFSQETIDANRGKLLTLDMDFGSRCSLNCPHCFKKGVKCDRKEIQLNIEQIKDLVIEAKVLGLKSIKIVGKGEPFETPEILSFIEFLNKNEIIPLIFTKGHILGSEKEVKRIYKNYGIESCNELVSKLYDFGVSILLGFNSFSFETQDKMVGNIQGYTSIRNRALELLINAGFNENNPTRLGLILAPLTNDNYDEAYDIYVWARRRNLYPVITPTMISGHLKNNDEWKKITPPKDKLIELYSKIYKFNIDNNIQSLSQVEMEGISAYAGVHPCNQVSTGLYITLNGTVLSCPGNDNDYLGDVKKETLNEIWQKHNKEYRFIFNNGCPAKCGKSIPDDFFEKVFLNLKNNL